VWVRCVPENYFCNASAGLIVRSINSAHYSPSHTALDFDQSKCVMGTYLPNKWKPFNDFILALNDLDKTEKIQKSRHVNFFHQW